jgi:glucosamine 6-phosphate synthetase-like amidotransferase/phosphosugar isomerase protein
MSALNEIPNKIEQVLESHLEIKKIAEEIAKYKNFFFL